MRTSFIKTAALLMMVMPFTLVSAAGHNIGKLAGTWEIQGTPEPTCGVQPFRNYSSFTRDGKIINVDPEVGTGVGEVYRLNGNRYAAGFFGFINDNGTILSYEVQGKLRLVDAGHFTGFFRTIVSDPAGNPACTYEGTLEGYRLVPMPY